MICVFERLKVLVVRVLSGDISVKMIRYVYVIFLLKLEWMSSVISVKVAGSLCSMILMSNCCLFFLC